MSRHLHAIPLTLISLFVAMFMAACAQNLWSEDPRTAATQQWALSCKAADANVQTATVLFKAGQLSDSAADAMDGAVLMYRVICEGEPPADDGALVSGAVKLLAAAVCPSLAPSDTDNWALTAAEAANCAAEAALLAEAS